jgi:uncharacterized membrane protein
MRRFRTVDRLAPHRRRFRAYVRAALYVGLLVWLALTALYLYEFHGGLSGDQALWGQFGDFLGGVLNPIFAFASFLIVLVALYEQRLQSEDERLDRNTQNALATMTEILHRVNDEVANLHYEYEHVVRDGVASARGTLVEVTGREVFRRMFAAALKKPYEHGSARDAPDRERYVALSKKLYAEWGHELGVYFRLLQHLFTFIDSSGLTFADKTRTANFARAQLSSYELSILFYDCLWGDGEATFKPLVEKYGLFKHLREQHVLNPRDLVPGALFAETAFVGFDRRLEIWKGVEPQLDAE